MGTRLSGWFSTSFFERPIHDEAADFSVVEKIPMRENARTCLAREGIVPASFFSPEIRESWKRCFDAGLDPFGDPTPIQISAFQLNSRREESNLVRRLAKMEMENLHRQIAGSNFIIIFADSDGIILDRVMDGPMATADSGRTLPGLHVAGRNKRDQCLGHGCRNTKARHRTRRRTLFQRLMQI